MCLCRKERRCVGVCASSIHTHIDTLYAQLICYLFGMGWLRSGGSSKLHVSFAKEPYEKDDILQKRPMILRNLLIVGTPYVYICIQKEREQQRETDRQRQKERQREKERESEREKMRIYVSACVYGRVCLCVCLSLLLHMCDDSSANR